MKKMHAMALIYAMVQITMLLNKTLRWQNMLSDSINEIICNSIINNAMASKMTWRHSFRSIYFAIFLHFFQEMLDYCLFSVINITQIVEKTFHGRIFPLHIHVIDFDQN